MFKELRDNPILIHQIRQAKWPSVQDALLFAAELTVIGLGLPFVGFAFLPDSIALVAILWIILPFALLLLFFGPLLMAVVAAVATVHAADSEFYQMIRLSQPSEHDIVSGYAATAIYRLRGLWMVAGGLIFPLALALIIIPFDMYLGILYHSTKHALMFTGWYVVFFISWSYLAAIFGTWSAFRHRQINKAIVETLLILVIVMAMQIAALLRAGYIAYKDWSFPLVIVLFVVIDIGMGWQAYREAVQHV